MEKFIKGTQPHFKSNEGLLSILLEIALMSTHFYKKNLPYIKTSKTKMNICSEGPFPS